MADRKKPEYYNRYTEPIRRFCIRFAVEHGRVTTRDVLDRYPQMPMACASSHLRKLRDEGYLDGAEKSRHAHAIINTATPSGVAYLQTESYGRKSVDGLTLAAMFGLIPNTRGENERTKRFARQINIGD